MAKMIKETKPSITMEFDFDEALRLAQTAQWQAKMTNNWYVVNTLDDLIRWVKENGGELGSGN